MFNAQSSIVIDALHGKITITDSLGFETVIGASGSNMGGAGCFVTEGNLTIARGNLTVHGDATTTGNLTVNGDVFLPGGADCAEHFDVAGNAELNREWL